MTPDNPFQRQFPDENYVPPDEADLRKQALQRAYEIARTITTEQERPKVAAPPMPWGPVLRGVNAVLALIVALWLWMAPPDWLPSRVRDSRSDEQRALGVRMVLAAEAARINDFYETKGRLPESLAESGGDGAGVRYVVLAPDHYRLTAADGAATAVYDSETPLATLLGGEAPQ